MLQLIVKDYDFAVVGILNVEFAKGISLEKQLSVCQWHKG